MADFTLDWEDDEPVSEKKYFIGREEFKQVLVSGVEDPQPMDERRVLVFYGAGGQGKSALKNDFFIKEYLNGPRAGNVVFSDRVDFEDQPKTRWADESLLRIAQDLIERGRIPLPAFCLGFIRYKMLTSPEANLQQEYPFLFKIKFIDNDFANDIVNTILTSSLELFAAGSGMVPGVNFFARKISEAGNRKIIEWIQKSDAKKVLGDIDDLNSLQLLQRLPLLLAYDIHKYLKRASQTKRIVIMIDGYETLWREAIHQAADKDLWIRTLVEKTPGVLFVFFGREELRWADKNEAFNNVLHQFLLKGLPETDADTFLQLRGINDNDIRDQIIKSAKVTGAEGDGCLPFYLELQIDTYLKMKKVGRNPVTADFHKFDDDVIIHFLEHLQPEIAAAVRALAAAPYIDEDIIELFVTNNLILPTAVSLKSLRGLSFIRMDGEKAMMHSLMRDLAVRQYADEFKLRYAKINHVLFEHFDLKVSVEAAGSVDFGVLLEYAAKYKALDDRSGYLQWVSNRTEVLPIGDGFNPLVVSVLEAGKNIFETDTKQRLGMEKIDSNSVNFDDAFSYARILLRLAKMYEVAGNYRLALDYSLSCAAFVKIDRLWFDHGRRTEDIQTRNKFHSFFKTRYDAAVLYANILDMADDNINADKFYKTAQNLKNDELFASNEIPYALYKSKMGRHVEAEPVLYAEYLKLKNEPRPSAIAISDAARNVALCLYRQQRYDEALKFQRESLDVLDAAGDKESSQYLKSQILLATILVETGLDLDRATSIYDHVLHAYRNKYEDDHLNFGHLYMGLSKLFSARGNETEMNKYYNLGAQILALKIGPGCRPIVEGGIELLSAQRRPSVTGVISEVVFRALSRSLTSMVQAGFEDIKTLLGAYNPLFHQTIDAAVDEFRKEGDETTSNTLMLEVGELRRLTQIYGNIPFTQFQHAELRGEEKSDAIKLLNTQISVPENVDLTKINLPFFKSFSLYRIEYKNTPLALNRFALMNGQKAKVLDNSTGPILDVFELDENLNQDNVVDYVEFYYSNTDKFKIIRKADDMPWRLNTDVTDTDKAMFARWINSPKILSVNADVIRIQCLVVNGDSISRCDFDVHKKQPMISGNTYRAGVCFLDNLWMYECRKDESLVLSGKVQQGEQEIRIYTDINGNRVELDEREQTFFEFNIAITPVYKERRLQTVDDVINQLLPIAKQYCDMIEVMTEREGIQGLAMLLGSLTKEFAELQNKDKKVDTTRLTFFLDGLIVLLDYSKSFVFAELPETDWRIVSNQTYINMCNYVLAELSKSKK